MIYLCVISFVEKSYINFIYKIFIVFLLKDDVIFSGLIVFFLIIASFYVWFVVYSTYKSLETKKGLTHEVHIMKKKYAVPVPLEVPKAVQISVNKPYEI